MKVHLFGTSLKAIGFILLILSAGIENPAYGGPIPALIDFDNDVPGAPPAIGGVNEPTSLNISANTSVLVRSASNGISTQPVVLNDGGTGDFISVNYALNTPVSSGLLRVEATISFNRFFSGFILQTTVGNLGAVVNRLRAISNGALEAEISGSTPRPIVGFYTPNQPFRVRMDIDIEGGAWSFILDDELNGFWDDPVIPDLPFVNDPSVLPSVGAVAGSLSVFGRPSASTTVAYDDISIKGLPSCDIQMSQPIFRLGENVIAESVRIVNTGAPQSVELKTWAVWPDGATSPIYTSSARGIFLQPRFDQDFGPQFLFTVRPGSPRGNYEFNCRVLDPVTGETLLLDVNAFDVR